MDLQHTSGNGPSDTHGFGDTGPSISGRKTVFARIVMAITALLVLGATVGALALRANAAPSPYVSLPNSVAPQVAAAKSVGATATDQKITLSLSLRSKNDAGLKDYANQVVAPKSKLYRQYLTPAQFAAVFGADSRALATAQSYMQSNGFRLESVASGGLFLTFSGTVAQAESAFKVHINNYQLDGRSFFANADNVQIPSALNGVLFNVAGLETARQLHPTVAAAPAKTATTAKPNATVVCATTYTTTYTAAANTSGANTTYNPTNMTAAQIAKAYNFPTTGTPGQNTWAAFLEFDGFTMSDLAQYANCASLSSTIQNNITSSPTSSAPFIIVQNTAQSYSTIPSASANYGTPLSAGNYAAQVTADLEVLLGLAPNLKNISVIQNNNTSNGLLYALSTVVNENAAQVIGISWGMCEADAGFGMAQSEEQLLMQAALQGQSVFAATGNNGLYACYGDANGLRQYGFAAQDPAADPFITAVGGTTLAVGVGSTTPTTTQNWSAEQPWTTLNPSTGIAASSFGAGGGGLSLFWAAPSWQINAKAAFTNYPTTGGALVGTLAGYNLNQAINQSTVPARVSPDVSAAADPTLSSVSIYCSAGSAPCSSGTTTFTSVGGTGVANAIWVAAASLAVQSANPSGFPPQVGVRLGLVAPLLYATYQNDLTTAPGTTTVGGATFTDYANQAYINTTTSTSMAITGGGTTTIVPLIMTGIVNGMTVNVTAGTGTGGAADNAITVSNVTTSSFQVSSIAAAHGTGFVVTPAVSTVTNAVAISAGTLATVTATGGTGMTGIVVGENLLIDSGASAEVVLVTGITATTFSAKFLNAHGASVAVVGTFQAAPVNSGSPTQMTTTGAAGYVLGQAAGKMAFSLTSAAGFQTGGYITIDTGGLKETVQLNLVSTTTPVYAAATFANIHATGAAVSTHSTLAAATGFNFGIPTAVVTGSYILNNAVPLSNTAGTNVVSLFTATATMGFQQPPSATSLTLYGGLAGFGVKGNFVTAGNTYFSGYNALTGLGSPNVGTMNTANLVTTSPANNGTGLVGYLASAIRVALPRVYMVAQASSSSTYWLASYAFNPYIQNMPSNTQWYQLSSTQIFSGAPTIVDDASFGGTATNLYIIGPSSATTSGIGIVQWNIPTQTATSITTQAGATGVPGAAPNNTCAAVNAFTNATISTAPNAIEVYCQTPGGNLYSAKIDGFGVTTGHTTGTAISVTMTFANAPAWSASPIFNQNISSVPQVATDGNGNYLVLTQTTGTSYAVLYQYFAGGTGFTTLSGLAPSFSFTTLATSCNSTPAVSYVSQIGSFAAACIANDTKAMWANFFNTSNAKFNTFWTFLGQPSSSVTFKPGAAVAADNVNVGSSITPPVSNDPGYGYLMYIAQGSDNGMYLSVVNTAQSNFIYKNTGWQSISLPGIFSSGSAAAFENA